MSANRSRSIRVFKFLNFFRFIKFFRTNFDDLTALKNARTDLSMSLLIFQTGVDKALNSEKAISKDVEPYIFKKIFAPPP